MMNHNLRSYSNRNKIWIYFKKCDSDSLNLSNSTSTASSNAYSSASTSLSSGQRIERVRCNLCSAELCNKGQGTAVLWNHFKSKHLKSLDAKELLNDFEQPELLGDSIQESVKQQQQNNSRIKHHSNQDQSNRSLETNRLDLAAAATGRTNNSTIPNSANNINRNNSNSNHNYNLTNSTSTATMTPLMKINSKSNRPKQQQQQHQSKQQSSDNDELLLYGYYSLLSNTTSMKPSPTNTNSLSKNLIFRLNQISSPITRRLKFWNKKSFQVNQYDPSFKVIYLGNLGMQFWSKDENCLEKPLSTLWNNYLVNMKTEIVMRLTICNSGLKAITRQHGLTQYWSNRLVYCCSHKNYPRIFSWIYRHEGKKMRQELRCHAVFCASPEKATKMAIILNQRLACALQEFKREKKSGSGGSLLQNHSSSSKLDEYCNSNNLSTSSPQQPSNQQKLPVRTIPLRRQILAKGTANFRPPLERSKSAPKLTSIQEEDYELDELCSQVDEYEFEEPYDCDIEEGDEGEHDDDDEDENEKSNDEIKKGASERSEANQEQSTQEVDDGSSSGSSSQVISNDESREKIAPPKIESNSLAIATNDGHSIDNNNVASAQSANLSDNYNFSNNANNNSQQLNIANANHWLLLRQPLSLYRKWLALSLMYKKNVHEYST